MVKIYGIKQCDKVRKSLKWLDEAGVAYDFVDVRQTHLTPVIIQGWQALKPLSELLNLRSTTYRALSEAEKASLDSLDNALPLLISQPTLFKRPLLEKDGQIYLDFKPDFYQEIFT
jgi:arsenate reductase